jgi:hypothetical protein
MRTYFILAALMGVFAFGSISLLAHAQEGDAGDNGGGTVTVTAPETPVDATPDPAGAVPEAEVPAEDTGEPNAEQAKRDKAVCRTIAYGKIRGNGVKDNRSQEMRDGQYMDCMSSMGYTSEEIENSNGQ